MNKSHNNDMMQRIVFYTFLIIVFCFAVFYKNIFNSINISIAEDCYKAKNYICAFGGYRKAFASGIDNKEYTNHYFQTLVKMKKIALVQEELYNLMQLYPDSPLNKDIEDIFYRIKVDVQSKYPETYINYVVQGTDVVHWNIVDAPINVFISQEGLKVQNFYIEEVKNAFADYQRISDNKIKFRYVNTADEADIIINFVEIISNGKTDDENNSKILGLTENNTQGGILRKSIVSLKSKDLDGTDFTSNQIHNIAKHEIGHALGITGHSFFSDDVMYPVNNDAKFDNNTLVISRKSFSSRDIQTLNLLYNIIPDVTNKKYFAEDVPDMYMPIAALGTKDQISQKKLEEANTYVNVVSNSLVSQMNLAESYFANKDFDNALNAFINALQMSKTNDEKFTAYHNIAVVYYQLNDIDNAIKYSEMANVYSDFSKGKSSDEILAYCYFERKRYKDAQVLLEKVIEINPSSPVASATLATSYAKQGKIFAVIKELKRIKSVNPSALNDTCFGGLGLFKLFI